MSNDQQTCALRNVNPLHCSALHILYIAETLRFSPFIATNSNPTPKWKVSLTQNIPHTYTKFKTKNRNQLLHSAGSEKSQY